MMPPNDIATVVVACVAVIGLIAAIVRWFFKRGADEREFSVALRENTEAVRELAKEFRRFRDEVVEKIHALDVRFTALDGRVTRLEVAPQPIHVTTQIEAPQHGSAPPYRDPGAPGGHQQG